MYGRSTEDLIMLAVVILRIDWCILVWEVALDAMIEKEMSAGWSYEYFI